MATSVLDEFDLGTGNERLLASCMAEADKEGGEVEPARIVLKKMRHRLLETSGVLIVT